MALIRSLSMARSNSAKTPLIWSRLGRRGCWSRRAAGEGRGRRRGPSFAKSYCSIDADLTRAAAVLGDLFRLTGVRYDAQRFAERALAVVLAHWPAVEALASALIEDRRIEGERVERIIDRSI